MKYYKIFWVSKESENPAIYYFEIDSENWETRKIEIGQDGSIGYASSGVEKGGVFQSEASLPPIQEIDADPQFFPFEISRDEFERVWKIAVAKFED